jgi:predicted enzyme related to lactoylglutathione lyase
MPGSNGIGWFEIGTDDPAAAERFYGDVFGWTVSGAGGHRLHQVVAFTTERVDAGVDAIHSGAFRSLRADGVSFASLAWPRRRR